MSAPRREVVTCVPTFNEAENIGPLLDAVLGVFDDSGIDGRVLVIDDNSPDGTADLADERARREPRVGVLRRPRKEGLGRAYHDGFRHALDGGADVVTQMDCDFSHDPAAIPSLLAALDDADVVLGSRYVPGGSVEGWPLTRRIISRGGCLYARLVLGIGVHDLTGGFKAFRRETLDYLLGRRIDARGYGFQIQMTYEAWIAGFRVREVPIVFRNREHGESKMSGAVVTEAAVLVPRLRLATRAERKARSTDARQ